MVFLTAACLQAVLQFKWDTYAAKWVAWEFICFLVWLACFSVFVILFQVRQCIHID
jgi:hypothetical protein